MNPLRALVAPDRRKPARSSVLPSAFQWVSLMGGGGFPSYTETLAGQSEKIAENFEGYVKGAYKRGGVVAAVYQARVMALAQIRFLFQDIADGRPGGFHDGSALGLLRRPWPGGTTQNLISRMETFNSFGGNAYATVRGGNRIKLMRPDWVTIVRMSDDDVDNPLDAELAGYIYHEGGKGSGHNPVLLMPDEVAHYAPLQDPLHEYRGMSWLTPVLRQISSHQAAAEHKWKFFEHGATPNMVIKFDPQTELADVKAFKELFDEAHEGAANAYRTAFLGGGGDPTVVGMDFKQLDFKGVQGADETLISAAGGVPPIIANLSEGIASATYSNYGQAKRHFNDTTVSFLAGELAASLEMVAKPSGGQRLWFDIRDVPFFRDDAKAEAEVKQMESAILRNLADGGWDPPSVVAAIDAQGDWSKLVHTGKLSVQLQEPGSGTDGSQRSDPWQLAQIVQKIYLGVGVVLTAEEARQIINDAGGNLPGDLPALPTPPTDPVPDTDEEPTT